MCIGIKHVMREDSKAMDKQDPTPLAYLAAYRDAIEPPAGAQEAMWAAVTTTPAPSVPVRTRLWGPVLGLSLAAAAACLWFFGQGFIAQGPSFKEEAQQAPYSQQDKQSPALLSGGTKTSQDAPTSVMPVKAPEPKPESESEVTPKDETAEVMPEVPTRTRRAPTTRPAPKPSEAPEVAGSIAGELRLLQQAEGFLHRQQYAKALEVLGQHAEEFGATGQLVPEVTASKVTALCRLGREQQASKLQRMFNRRWPKSPLRSRVDSACAPQEKNP